jgi:hypothetical protein
MNKQYTKEDWEIEVTSIMENMERDGTLGQFFPPQMNPFYFNDTFASLIYDDFTREEVTAAGYLWRDAPIQADIPTGADVVQNTELDRFQGYDTAGVWQINRDILSKVIVDESGNYYRIVPWEYDFLVRHALPLPTLHWLDRIKMGFRG